MAFPQNDEYWAEALAFLKDHHKQGELVLAPEEFSEKITGVRSYSLTFATRSALYPWTVLHKGRVKDFDERFLVALYEKTAPVFANAVFAIFSANGALEALDWQDPHLSGLGEEIGNLNAWKTPQQAAEHAPAAPETTAGPEIAALRRELEDLRLAHWKLAAEHASSIRLLTQHAANLRGEEMRDGSAVGAAAGPLKISIIMPVHNRAGMVGAAVGSVLSQRYTNRELIVVDDGSVDGIDAAMAPHLGTPGVVYLKIAHGGAGRARNAALKVCTGDLVAYLDSDNLMYPGYLGAAAAVFEADPRVMCAHAAMLWDDGKNSVNLRQDAFVWEDYLAFRINLDLNAFVYRRALYETLGGFDEELLCHGDHDLVLRYSRAHPVAEIPAISAHYRAGSWERNSNSLPSAPFFHRIASRHAPRIARPMRVLTVCAYDTQLSESYVDGEVRWMLGRGVEEEVHAEQAATGVGKAPAPVHRGSLEEAIAAFRPELVHIHWLSLAARHLETLEKCGLPVTIRSHGFDASREFVEACAASPVVRSIYMFPHQAGQFAGVGKIKPLPVALDSSRFYPRLGRDTRLVLRAGACLPTKDLATFIRVAARCPEYHFILALARTGTGLDLLDELQALNQSLGNPVEMRIDVQYDEMALLTARAGVYLHTFGFMAPFGMPISIAEAMACGAVPLVRDCEPARAYAGEGAEYYNTEEEAIAILQAMLSWTPEQWTARARANAEHAYRHHCDRLVLGHILEDWIGITGSNQNS